MKTKELTIYKGRGTNYNLPQIVLQGQWLENIGFFIENKVTVTYEQNRIIISNKTTEQITNNSKQHMADTEMAVCVRKPANKKSSVF